MDTINKLKSVVMNFFINKNKRKTLITYIALPILLNLVIEVLGRGSVIQGVKYIFIHPVSFYCNTMIILLTLMISVFFRRRIFCLSLVSFIWLLLGFTNFILLSNRVTPFNATDILLMKPALAVITKYYNTFQIGLIIGVIILAVFLVVFLWFKAPKLKYKVNYVRNAIVAAAVVVLTFSSLNIAIDTGFITVKFDNLANAYLDYGFPYCFANSAINTGVSKPADYSAQKIEEIITESETQEVAEVSTVVSTPNIIFLQLESFFDVSRYKDLVLSENPIPNFTQLAEQYPSGFFNVPVVGAGTANTEFEVLSGMNMDDFGPGEYPYKTVLQSTTCESISYNLKENGYVTHAIHNNSGTFYQRHTVFSQLGFDTFTPIEYMNVTEYTYRNWSKDKVLTGEIMKCLNSTPGQDFVYTISVEGHGSYPGYQVLEDPQIKVEQIGNEAKKYAVEYYVNLLYSMDQFIGELINTLSSYDEDIILVMYGDHLPSLGISNDQLNSGTTLQTEYIIWNNMNLDIGTEDVEAYQMSSKIMQLLGMDTGVINKYHQTHKNSEEYLNGLQNLEFDLLYGDKTAFNGVNPYVATDIQMGVDKIQITGIEPDPESSESLIVRGENFTKYSVIYINDDEVKTKYVDANTLQIEYTDLKSQDSFKAAQKGSDSFVLSYSEEYVYN